ncbi:MAG: sulfatase-like hydrolase/transferase [Phycisphaerae bacterium]|nr:sulfatase-like hydrolase/transferase [Phycisphaerae bacterium]
MFSYTDARRVLSSHRSSLRLLAGAVLALSATSPVAAAHPETAAISRRPNVVLLLTDDQRFDTIAALGNREIRTPNMDRLAASGVAFTHAHVMGSMHGAVCMPSRAMLMTSRTLFHLRPNAAVIPPEHLTLPELLRRHGYVTFGTGKWHNDRASFARCFTRGGNVFFGGMSDHLRVPVYDFDPTGQYPEGRNRPGEKFSSELFSDTAIRFLHDYKGDKPFFLYVAFTAPHDPRMAPQEYATLYPTTGVLLPPNFLPEHPFDNGDLRGRDEQLAPWPRTPEIARQHIAAYYAMITHLDAQIGRILDTLKETGDAENTIVILAGDNGLAVGRHGLMGKQSLYEHSGRVPLLIAGPGLPRAEKRNALCYLLDIYPTLCDLLEVPTPIEIEGRSLFPVASKGGPGPRDHLFLSYRDCQRALRTDRWKLILYNVAGQETTQLFDLQQDPWETKNLAGDPSQLERVRELKARLTVEMKQHGDPCDLSKPNWGRPTAQKPPNR